MKRLKYEDRQFSDEKVKKLEKILRSSVISSSLVGILALAFILYSYFSPSFLSANIRIGIVIILVLLCLIPFYFTVKFRKTFLQGENDNEK